MDQPQLSESQGTSSQPNGEGAGARDELSAVQRDAQNGVTEREGLVGKAVEVLRAIYDPEIPVNIYDLGLIYEVKESAPGKIAVRMTLTSPMCPIAEYLPPEVKHRIEAEAGAEEATVDLVWEPPWTPDKMSEAARLQLNFF
jgi:FeS assembly SUF system protein